MARKRRLTRVGFYHVLNRGVAKDRIYFEDRDYRKFLEIVEEASTEYDFEVYSFCLMGNHYHLLLKTKDENLSVFMQKIGSRYSIYYNARYDRVGPLWQGRFKSYFVYNEKYLHILLRYIEFNPIKAGITKEIGHYKWSMSSENVESSMLNYELLASVSLERDLDEAEMAEIETFHNAKSDIQEGEIGVRELTPLSSYFRAGHGEKNSSGYKSAHRSGQRSENSFGQDIVQDQKNTDPAENGLSDEDRPHPDNERQRTDSVRQCEENDKQRPDSVPFASPTGAPPSLCPAPTPAAEAIAMEMPPAPPAGAAPAPGPAGEALAMERTPFPPDADPPSGPVLAPVPPAPVTENRDALDAEIMRAIRDGHSATEVARYLNLSKAAVSKRRKNYQQKEKLFEKLRDKGLFWSYEKGISYREAGAKLLIEHTLKYADFDDIKRCCELFGKRAVQKIWEKQMKSDKSFIKTNLMLARVFFGMDVESTFFKEAENERLKKLRVLAS